MDMFSTIAEDNENLHSLTRSDVGLTDDNEVVKLNTTQAIVDQA